MVRSLSFSASAVPKVLGVKANLSFFVFGLPLGPGTGVSSNMIPHQGTRALGSLFNFVLRRGSWFVLMLPLCGAALLKLCCFKPYCDLHWCSPAPGGALLEMGSSEEPISRSVRVFVNSQERFSFALRRTAGRHDRVLLRRRGRRAPRGSQRSVSRWRVILANHGPDDTTTLPPPPPAASG